MNDFLKLFFAIVAFVAIVFCLVKVNEIKAERYNENFGTNFSAFDIMMGLHKNVRDVK